MNTSQNQFYSADSGTKKRDCTLVPLCSQLRHLKYKYVKITFGKLNIFVVDKVKLGHRRAGTSKQGHSFSCDPNAFIEVKLEIKHWKGFLKTRKSTPVFKENTHVVLTQEEPLDAACFHSSLSLRV